MIKTIAFLIQMAPVVSSSTSGEYVDAKSHPPSPEVPDHQISHEYQSRFLNDFEPVRRLGKVKSNTVNCATQGSILQNW